MRIALTLAALLAGTGLSRAGDLDVRIMLSGEVAPGVYGQVRIGNDPPPPLVYAQPMLIVVQAAPPPPIYLHVPPGHARNWRKHCREYNACNRPVYFIRSEEYQPGYVYRGNGREHDGREHGNGREHGDGHEHGDGREHERSSHRDDDHDHGHEGRD